MSFRERILRLLDIPAEGMLTLAFSGGSDSLALASLLPRERTRCVYIDHNIRGREELDREIALNRENCRKLGLELEVITLPENSVQNKAKDGKMGTEAAAREFRYEALLSSTDSWVLTAHHLDDQAETVIMRILSGSPIYRMEGIRKRNGRIVRPMLAVPKEWIMGMLEEEGLNWSFDSTNDDTDLRRNSIRKNIIPHLSIEQKEILYRIAENVSLMNEGRKPIEYTRGAYYAFRRSEFLESDEMRREEVFFNINRDENNPERLSRKEIEVLSSAIEKGIKAEISRFFMYIKKDEVRIYPSIPEMVYPVKGDLETDRFSLSFNAPDCDNLTLRLSPDRIEPPLIIRTSREKDTIDLVEGTKTARALEKEWKIPYSLVLEDRNGIIAVFGRFLGGRDRLSSYFIESDNAHITVACRD